MPKKLDPPAGPLMPNWLPVEAGPVRGLAKKLEGGTEADRLSSEKLGAAVARVKGLDTGRGRDAPNSAAEEGVPPSALSEKGNFDGAA